MSSYFFHSVALDSIIHHSQLIVTNKNGEETIIYDVNSAQFSKATAVAAVVTVFVCFAGAVVIWRFIKQKRDS